MADNQLTADDRLAEIKARWPRRLGLDGMPEPQAPVDRDMEWLIGEVEWLIGEVGRLRSLLARLEWGRWGGECAACGASGFMSDPTREDHEPGCWLAAELAR